VVGADALGGQFALGGGERAPVTVDDLPGRGDEAGEGLAGFAGQVDGGQDLVGLVQGIGEGGVDELGPGREVAVQGDPADPSGGGDVGDAGLRTRQSSAASRMAAMLRRASARRGGVRVEARADGPSGIWSAYLEHRCISKRALSDSLDLGGLGD
jgi:hypothetical protein